MISNIVIDTVSNTTYKGDERESYREGVVDALPLAWALQADGAAHSLGHAIRGLVVVGAVGAARIACSSCGAAPVCTSRTSSIWLHPTLAMAQTQTRTRTRT